MNIFEARRGAISLAVACVRAGSQSSRRHRPAVHRYPSKWSLNGAIKWNVWLAAIVRIYIRRRSIKPRDSNTTTTTTAVCRRRAVTCGRPLRSCSTSLSVGHPLAGPPELQMTRCPIVSAMMNCRKQTASAASSPTRVNRFARVVALTHTHTHTHTHGQRRGRLTDERCGWSSRTAYHFLCDCLRPVAAAMTSCSSGA